MDVIAEQIVRNAVRDVSRGIVDGEVAIHLGDGRTVIIFRERTGETKVQIVT